MEFSLCHCLSVYCPAGMSSGSSVTTAANVVAPRNMTLVRHDRHVRIACKHPHVHTRTNTVQSILAHAHSVWLTVTQTGKNCPLHRANDSKINLSQNKMMQKLLFGHLWTWSSDGEMSVKAKEKHAPQGSSWWSKGILKETWKMFLSFQLQEPQINPFYCKTNCSICRMSPIKVI